MIGKRKLRKIEPIPEGCYCLNDSNWLTKYSCFPVESSLNNMVNLNDPYTLAVNPSRMLKSIEKVYRIATQT